MQRKLVSALLLSCLVLSSIPAIFSLSSVDEQHTAITYVNPLNFNSLTEVFGKIIPVVVKFENGLTSSLLDIINSLDLEFSLGSPSMSHVGPYYLLDGSVDSLELLMSLNVVSEVAAQTHVQFLESTRDVSIPEINADDVWNALDDLGRNITGEGILIADLDSGVDWRHPDLWFADGGTFDWLDSGTANSIFDNGTDGVDLDVDGTIMFDEVLYALDLSADGLFDTPFEWLWADNVTQNGIPDIGEPFFVVNDTSGDGQLDLGEPLVMLGTPKTKYIFENDGTPSPQMQSWVRGVNLTTSTHTDDSPYGGGHGTAVSGILLGGQLGYRQYVGVAPDAELMMIRVLGDQYTWLSIEEGLAIANNTGADVILTEVGSWTYEYLDGSSLAEQLIDELVADGIPVISPSGNLGGKDKHALVTTAADTPHLIDFTIPSHLVDPYISEEITNVYITVLTVDLTDFVASDFSIIISGTTINLNPGIGEWNWFTEPNVIPGLNVRSFTSISSRGTRMLAIWLYGVLPTTSGAPWHQLNISTPDPTTIHAYISDDQSSWTGGCVWMSDISNAYQICWPSTADRTVSVASYRTRGLVGAETIGDIASFSSIGPRIDGVQKQGVAAPGGYDVISDYADGSSWSSWYNAGGTLSFNQGFGSYRLFSGTSASGPHVAGCAALMLQVNSTIGDQIQSIIESTARKDTFTGPSASDEWGNGKLDVNASVTMLLDDLLAPTIHTINRTPSAPINLDSVTINVLVTDDSEVDTVILSYHNGTTWFNATMTWAGSDYEGIIPALPNGTLVSYRVYANDTSGNWATSGISNYTVQEDLLAPTIHTINRTPSAPTELDSATINVSVTDDQGVDTVILSYHNGTTWFNVTMTWAGSDYEGVIPALPNGTLVSYRVYANDTHGNWAVSGTSSYTVQDSTTTTTTTTTTTITTTTTSTTIPDDQFDPMRLLLLLTGVLVIIVVSIVYSRRRSR